MTNTTMILLEQVLREQEDVDGYISKIADALDQYRATRKAEDERALGEVARDYIYGVDHSGNRKVLSEMYATEENCLGQRQ